MAEEIERKEKGSVNVQISLKALVPVVPKTPTARRELEEDLERIGCAGLLNKPWNIKDEGMVRKLLEGAPNQFDHTIQCKLGKWIALVWREAYGFKPEGYGWTSRTNKYIVGQFSKSVNPKDGYTIGDCEDFQAKQVLEFLIPILYPEKPTQVIVTVGNTVFEALLGDRPVDWGLLIYDVVTRMVRLVSKGKPTMVCPFMFHLYKERQVLRNWRPTPWQWRWSSMTVLQIRNLIRNGLRRHHIPVPTDRDQPPHRRGARRRRRRLRGGVSLHPNGRIRIRMSQVLPKWSGTLRLSITP